MGVLMVTALEYLAAGESAKVAGGSVMGMGMGGEKTAATGVKGGDLDRVVRSRVAHSCRIVRVNCARSSLNAAGGWMTTKGVARWELLRRRT